MPRRGKNYTDRMRGPTGVCELCGRDTVITAHHLIPRAVHRKNYFQKRFSKAEMTSRLLWACRPCHKGIHRIVPDEKELARDYNTKERLLADERIRRHVAWVAKQK